MLFRLPDGLTRRGDINLLMLGDPGTAKSQLLKFVERCSPIGVSCLETLGTSGFFLSGTQIWFGNSALWCNDLQKIWWVGDCFMQAWPDHQGQRCAALFYSKFQNLAPVFSSDCEAGKILTTTVFLACSNINWETVLALVCLSALYSMGGGVGCPFRAFP